MYDSKRCSRPLVSGSVLLQRIMGLEGSNGQGSAADFGVGVGTVIRHAKYGATNIVARIAEGRKYPAGKPRSSIQRTAANLGPPGITSG
jgi:hypothetical protein